MIRTYTNSRAACAALLVALGLACEAQEVERDAKECATEAYKQECRGAITNGPCTIYLERKGPVSPLPVKVKPGAKVCISIDKFAAESIGFEAEYKDVVAPDPLAAIGGALAPILKSFVVGTSAAGAPITGFAIDPDGNPAQPPATESDLSTKIAMLEGRLGWIAGQQKSSLETAVRANAVLSYRKSAMAALREIPLKEYARRFAKLSCVVERECPVDMAPAALNLDLPSLRLVAVELEMLSYTITELRPQALGAGQIEAVQKRFAAVLKALEAADANHRNLTAMFQTLEKSRDASNELFAALPKPENVVERMYHLLNPASDDKNIQSLGVYRSSTVKMTATDLVTKEKKPLASVNVVWGASRWEMSGGLLFSNAAVKSFTAAPKIENGAAVKDPAGIAINYVTVTRTKPLIVPAALFHYRLAETGRRDRLALLATGAAGVNPSSTSADFGGGLSVAWRSLVISFLAHGMRDLVLTNGFAVGQPLGPNASAPTSTRQWALKGAIGISYRLPIP